MELQHSPIGPDDVAAREAFYGDMVWLFDATERFATIRSGERAFFSLGRTKHLDLCKKPVFLDFGYELVEVERFTDAVHGFSGFGWSRTREWFADNYLSDVRNDLALRPWQPDASGRPSDPWASKNPYRKMDFPTRWAVPGSSDVVAFPKWTPYVPLLWYSYRVLNKDDKTWNWERVIDELPSLANGWTKEGMRAMEAFFAGTPVILGGLLRLLPSPPAKIQVASTVRSVELSLQQAEEHIRAGRLPILKEDTKRSLVDRARRYEVQRFGRAAASAGSQGVQRGLFD